MGGKYRGEGEEGRGRVPSLATVQEEGEGGRGKGLGFWGQGIECRAGAGFRGEGLGFRGKHGCGGFGGRQPPKVEGKDVGGLGGGRV